MKSVIKLTDHKTGEPVYIGLPIKSMVRKDGHTKVFPFFPSPGSPCACFQVEESPDDVMDKANQVCILTRNDVFRADNQLMNEGDEA